MMPLIAQFAAAEEESGIAVLGVDPVALLLQLLTFLLLFLLLRKFAFKTIVRILEERRRTINQGVDLGQEMALEKQQLDEQVQKVLHQARLEADKVIAASHQEAGSILKEAEAAAARKADALVADAHAKIEDDIRQAKAALEKEMLQLVAKATERVITEKLDPKKDTNLIERALRSATQ